MDTAFIFPGQGSQYIGMMKDFYVRYPHIFNQLLKKLLINYILISRRFALMEANRN